MLGAIIEDSSSSNVSGEEQLFPESPEDVNNWARRREAAARAPPVAPALAELPGTWPEEPPSYPGDFEDDEGLAKAIEQSLIEGQHQARRSSTGTDADELARVLEISKIDK
jgi:hypothetical protein